MANENIHPWIHLWVKPRKTIRTLLNTDPKKFVAVLAILGGIFSAFLFAAHSWHTPRNGWYIALATVTLIVIGGVIGLVHLYFSSWLLSLTGSWLGGKGDFTSVKCAVGWSNYPFIIADIFAILMAIFFRNVWLAAFFGLLNVILLIWGFIVFFKIVGESLQISAWKAFLALIIAFILIFVVMILVALIIPLISPLFK